MCGRLENKLTSEDDSSLFNVTPLFDDLPEFDEVRPTDRTPIVLPDHTGTPELRLARWGFRTPAGSSKKLTLFNARDDKLEGSTIWREAFRSRWCLVPASGFFEWSGPKGARTKHRLGLVSRHGFGMAGIWQTTEDGLLECSIITTTPNAVVAEVHDRMPVIVKPRDYETWLAVDGCREDLRAILRPYPHWNLKKH